MSLLGLACLQGGLAAIVSALLLAPRWWWPIHLVFVPALVLAIQLQLPISIYAAGFFILLLTYWSTFRTQVPLFLSNRITVHRLAAWLADDQALKVLDLGSGTGSFALSLAQLRPDWRVTGIESAPGPFVISRWLGRKANNLTLLRADFWPHSLASYDVVYAFLSPVPMPSLWQKARKEMRPGSLLISNSFPIPGITPDKILSINDRRQTQLFVYRIPSGKTHKGATGNTAEVIRF
ncbi:class I SAM-dependent methyltransferase [Uliginosibacterium flavum]|uniref:Methyltransferase domain-containing protein n=1 Tax=Uliginosibacterium flavum TaxID=1396831 RepID=A0ABV2TMW2_9RHOO